MALIVGPLSFAVSAANNGGICTTASTASLYPSHKGFLTKTGVESVYIEVTQIISATQFRARLAETSNPGSNLSAFDGGGCTFTSEAQAVAVGSDGQKLPVY